MGFRILTLNDIATRGLERLPREHYEVGSRVTDPDAVLVRSADMHALALGPRLLAVARAGAGTNNIPVAALTRRGIPVFNAPGANANAVKELVVVALLLAARNVCQAWEFVRKLKAPEAEFEARIEAGKKQFIGYELPGRTLGVVGLGAVGVEVANVALALGMKVLGYDREITVQRAWQLSSGVQQALSVEDLFARAEIVTLHVPLVEATRDLVDAARIGAMPKGAALLNFARPGIVVEADVLAALDSGRLSAYVCDFPTAAIKDHPRVVALPHLGASTGEAEDNCAVMVVETLREYLENGTLRHAVNFPEAQLPRIPGTWRLAIANANVPNMVGQISTALAAAGLNIADLLNKSQGEVAYTLIDTETPVTPALLAQVSAIGGVLAARAL